MRNRSRLLRLLGVLFAFALIVAACGDDDSGSSGDQASGDQTSGDTWASQHDLSGNSYTVGSKDFTEQIVLGQILVQALEAAGADVNDQTNLGGTVQNREALLSGDIDMYWEYNGTGWQVHLEQPDPSSDPAQLTEDVRALDKKENGIEWLGRSPFNDTYGFATPPDVGPITLEEMAQQIKDDSSLTVCLESEFPTRDDGLVLFEDKYGVKVPQDQIQVLDTGVIYQEVANGNCDFGEVFTTDGRIAGLDLNLVEDPGVFILYNVSLTMPTDVYQTAPDAFDSLVEAILSPLDEAKMTELNRKRDVEGQDAADIAAEYLKEQGIA